MKPTAYEFKPLGSEIEAATVGHVGPMAERYVETGIPFLRSQNIKPNSVSFADVKFIDEKFHSELRKSSLKAGDVVVVRTGYPGTAAVVTTEMLPMNCADLVIITPGEKVDSRYLASLLNSNFGKALVTGNTVGAAQQHFNVTTAKQIKVPLPPLNIQRKIAAILTAYDDLIENNRQRIALLEKMAEEIYREWFVRLRFPGHEHTPMHKGVPEGWKPTTLFDLCRLKRGYDLPKQSVIAGKYPILAATGIAGFHNAYKAEPPVVTTGRSGSLGAVVWSSEPSWPLNTSLYVADNKGNSKHFLFYTLKSANLAQFNSGAGVPTLNRNHLSCVKVLRPPRDIQSSFDRIASAIRDQTNTLRRSNDLLGNTRDLLLNRLISGKLRVDDLDIQFPPSMQEDTA